MAQQSRTQIYEGILYKQNKSSSAWKERFFVLYSDRTLSYFKSESAWDKGRAAISTIDLSTVRSISQSEHKSAQTPEPTSKSKSKEKKKRKRSLSRKWSIDLGALFGGGNKNGENGDESDDEKDGEIAFIELVLSRQLCIEIVQAKRTYTLCTDDASALSSWLSKLESVAFGKRVFAGWLLKQSERSKAWERRWFCLYDTLEMRYYDDASRAVSRGLAVLTQLRKISQVEEARAQKKYKQQSVLKLEFKQRTLLLSCSVSDDRRIWFDQICRLVPGCRYIGGRAVYDDFLFRYDEANGRWSRRWYLLTRDELMEFGDMEACDELGRHGWWDAKEYAKVSRKLVTDKIAWEAPLDAKSVQKIRPGSKLQKKLVKECIFIVHSAKLGKLFFATEQSNQLNRWFKKIRSLAGDEGQRKKRGSRSEISRSSQVMDSGSASRGGSSLGDSKLSEGTQTSGKGGGGKRELLRMLREVEADLNECGKDVKYIKKCWEQNNAESDEE